MENVFFFFFFFFFFSLQSLNIDLLYFELLNDHEIWRNNIFLRRVTE